MHPSAMPFTGPAKRNMAGFLLLTLAPALSRHHVKWPHHFIVLMLQQVAMPHVPSFEALEPCNDPRYHSRRRSYRVFPSHLARLRRRNWRQISNLGLGPV